MLIVQVQVVYQFGFVLLYGVYPKAVVISEQVLNVHVQVVYQLGLVELYGVYHNAVVTLAQLIHVIYPLSFVKHDTFVGCHVRSQYFQLVDTAHKLAALA